MGGGGGGGAGLEYWGPRFRILGGGGQGGGGKFPAGTGRRNGVDAT